jgi:hypothetical protein
LSRGTDEEFPWSDGHHGVWVRGRVCMYVCEHVCVCALKVCVHGCMSVCTSACVHLRVCEHACVHVRVYVGGGERGYSGAHQGEACTTHWVRARGRDGASRGRRGAGHGPWGCRCSSGLLLDHNATHAWHAKYDTACIRQPHMNTCLSVKVRCCGVCRGAKQRGTFLGETPPPPPTPFASPPPSLQLPLPHHHSHHHHSLYHNITTTTNNKYNSSSL